MTAAKTRSEDLDIVLGELADGEWHDGLSVVRALERTIPPGEASRIGAGRRKGPATPEELIRTGRRDKSRAVIKSALNAGRIECDVERLGKAAWSGVMPWRLRDPQAGYLSAQEVADLLDVGNHVVRLWAKHGFVPHAESAAGYLRFSPAHVEVCRRVRQIYTPGALRWPVDPRSLWTETEVQPLPTIDCPHCSQPVTLTVGKL